MSVKRYGEKNDLEIAIHDEGCGCCALDPIGLIKEGSPDTRTGRNAALAAIKSEREDLEKQLRYLDEAEKILRSELALPYES